VAHALSLNALDVCSIGAGEEEEAEAEAEEDEEETLGG